MINDKLSATTIRKNSDTNLKRKEIKYAIGESIPESFLMEEILCFGHTEKLSPKYIRPYGIVERVRSIAYWSTI